MNIKEYIKKLASDYPADSDDPTVIVQQLACLAGMRLSEQGKIPAACGVGDRLDMDIIQAGILAGLERVRHYDGTIGTMRAFLYKTIAGTMQNYAWKRENRVTDGIWEFPEKVFDSESQMPPCEEGTDKGMGMPKAQVLIEDSTPETILEREQDTTSADQLTGLTDLLGREAIGLLLKDASLGYNATARHKWAAEIGVSIGALNMRLVRLRQKAREWALNVQ